MFARARVRQRSVGATGESQRVGRQEKGRQTQEADRKATSCLDIRNTHGCTQAGTNTYADAVSFESIGSTLEAWS